MVAKRVETGEVEKLATANAFAFIEEYNGRVYLSAIFVRTSLRGQGIGSELLAQIVKSFPGRRITVRSLGERVPFFERLGFVCEPERRSRDFFVLRVGPPDKTRALKSAP